jgi:hypothetical protein
MRRVAGAFHGNLRYGDFNIAKIAGAQYDVGRAGILL